MIENVPCQQALLLSLLNPLTSIGYIEAMSGLFVPELDRYSNEQLQLSLVFLVAWGVFRVSHINDQPIEDWGVLLDRPRRPDGDTLDQYLNRLIELDEIDAEFSVVERHGQIQPGGLIDRAQQASLYNWVSAGLLAGDVWRFDGHVIEYTGDADLDKTKHGTKQCSVKAIKRYTLQNGLSSLTEYFPSHITFADALRTLVTKANNCLPKAYKIRILAFDREGWDTDVLNWLQKQKIASITWVKKTASNVQSLQNVPDEEFVTIEKRPFGKAKPQQLVRLADTEISFDSLGVQRTVVLETEQNYRYGIYTTVLKPQLENDLQKLSEGTANALEQQDNWPSMTAIELYDAMRFKQRIENQFKVEMHEMGSDALPTHITYKTNVVQAYDIEKKQNQLNNALMRLPKYAAEYEQQEKLHQDKQLDIHQLNLLNKRTLRLQQQTSCEIENLTQEKNRLQTDKNGNIVLLEPTEVLDVRKLTLFNLFKLHALVALKKLAGLLKIDEANPERLRRSFLSFGSSVEFNHVENVATVYVNRLPRHQTRQAYQQLCDLSQKEPIILTRQGVKYQVHFSY